jgi:hypothetical protein
VPDDVDGDVPSVRHVHDIAIDVEDLAIEHSIV